MEGILGLYEYGTRVKELGGLGRNMFRRSAVCHSSWITPMMGCTHHSCMLHCIVLVLVRVLE